MIPERMTHTSIFISLIFVICIWSSEGSSSRSEESDTGLDACSSMLCRAGRECRILENGSPACVCVKSCPDHHTPVCGTNGISYENHCLLHRDACLREIPISIKHPGFCKSEEHGIKSKVQKRKPVVCFQGERDQMRQLIIGWIKNKLEQDDWFRKGISYQEVIKELFMQCDEDKDELLDPSEFLKCVKKNETILHVREGENSELVSALCVDAIIEATDTDSDWLLSFEEFKSCMDPKFQPPQKTCSLEDKTYHDGTEKVVDCNSCVCACGNWVCTAMACEDNENSDESEDEEDNALMKKEKWNRVIKKLKVHDDST